MPDPRLPERVARLLVPEPNTGCWLYVGTRVTRNGYPRLWWRGKERVLHRIVYELLVGEIPPGLLLDHGPTCPVVCCNPFPHNGTCKEPVTVRENTLRGRAVLLTSVGRGD